MNRLAGKVAIVTGAAGRIGARTAQVLAAESARVVVADMNAAGAIEVASAIAADGWEAIAVPVDISSESSVAAMIAATIEAFGQLDVLHNNAAATTLAIRDVPIHESDEGLWREAMQTNVIGTMLCTKHALRYMLGRGGSIINTASNAGHHGDLSHPAYGASKAAVVALTQYAATMYGKDGVRVNAISPGLVLDDSTDGEVVVDGPMAAFTTLMLDNMLTTRVGKPRDIAYAVLYLASDEAQYVTGQVLHVDGGATAQPPYYGQLRAAGGWAGIMG